MLMLPRLPFLPPVTSLRRTICLSKMSTTAGPVSPKFIPVEQTEITSVSKADGFRFRLVSYNILAQAYVKSALFPHSPSPCLSIISIVVRMMLCHDVWEVIQTVVLEKLGIGMNIYRWKARSQAILAVLKSLEADFLCLQELDEYDAFYKDNIESSGYSSIYIQRSGQKRDGCGIFYKPNKSELVVVEKIDYNDLVNLIQDEATLSVDQDKSTLAPGSKDGAAKEELEKGQGNRGDPNDPRVRLKRDCVGVMAAFKIKDPSQHFLIVANTHIYWDPEFADVKLAQVKYLLSRIAQFKTMLSNRYECTPSLIIAGDFNSVPGDEVYQYLVSGSSTMVPPSESSEDLPIPLSSVYACTKGEPHFTNCTPGFTGTLDYVFFTPTEEIKPIGFLELPEAEAPDVNGGLPNYFHPSDHLPIGVDFLLEV